MRKLTLLSVAVMVVLAGCGGFSGTPAPEATPTPTPGDGTPVETTPGETATPTATPDELPEGDEDTLGYANGVWYNQSVDVDTSDGIDDEELGLLKNRTMARLEVLRGLNFEEDVPVEIKTREQYREELESSGTFDVSENMKTHTNVKWEATFMVGDDRDAIEELQAFYAGGVLGYYDSETDQLVVISPEGEEGVPSGLDEMTLAHELVHALQDQHFNLSKPKFQGATTETDNAVSGLVEGDAKYVEYLYEQRCNEGEWDCLEKPDRSGGGDFHVGIWAVQFAPYSEGGTFVESIHKRQGWEGVNELYEDPPDSTSQVIHPSKYPDDTPVEVTVEDRSSDEWSVPENEDGVNYASIGEAGLYAMFWYPSYEATQEAGMLTNVVIDYRDFFNLDGPGGELPALGPYDYSHEITEGWKGDKLYPYENGAGETGYVWKLEWASDEDAEEFVSAYLELLDYHGAEQVNSNVYRITGGGEFEGAFSVTRDGSTVVIVHAPSVDQLDEIRDGAGP